MFILLLRISRVRKYMLNVLCLRLEFTNAWVHTMFIFLGLGYLTLHSVSISIHFQAKFKMLLFFFPPMSSTLISRSVTISLSIHSSINGLFSCSFCYKSYCYIQSWTNAFAGWLGILGYIPKSGIAGSLGRLTPNFLKYSHSVFQSSGITLQTHQHEMSVSLTQHTLQQRLSLVFLI